MTDSYPFIVFGDEFKGKRPVAMQNYLAIDLQAGIQ